MSAQVKLSTKLPGDDTTNGLDAMAAALCDDPDAFTVAVVWLDTSKVTIDTDTGAHVPTVRVRRVEPLGAPSDVAPAVMQAVAEAEEARTGRTPLPFETVTVDRELEDE